MEENKTQQHVEPNAENQAPELTAPAVSQENAAAASQKELFKRNWKKWLILIACVLIVIGAGTAILVSRSAESVAKRFSIAYYTNEKRFASLLAYDYKAAQLSPYKGDEDAFFEEKAEKYGVDISSWNDYFKACDEDFAEYLQDEYGKYKVTAKVTRSKDISVKKLLEDQSYWLDTLEKSADFDRDQITDAKLITVKLKLDGEDGNDRGSLSLYMAKVGGSWKALAYTTN